MKSIFIALLVTALTFVACSPTETIIEEEPEEEISHLPEWFDRTTYSSADTLSFYGFAMASSTQLAEAERLSEETALNNLRFEIDKHAEEIRRTLKEGDSQYATTSFILELRTSVRNLNLNDARLTSVEETGANGVVYVYTKAVLDREAVQQLLEGALNDPRFAEHFSQD